jgi:ketosteroid isomerase-like protein
MSEENVEIVRSAFSAFEQGEVSELLDRLTDDLTTHRVEPDNAIYHGKEGFLQATADWIEDFDDWTVAPEAFLEVDDRVVVRVTQAARGERSGVPVEGLAWFVFHLRGGKIARMSIHLREAQAFEAAGLPGVG